MFQSTNLMRIQITFLTFLLTLITSGILFGQENPVKWSAEQIKEGNDNQILVRAEIEDNWHIYSMYLTDDFGPIPTTITFSENDLVKFDGKIEQGKTKREKDVNFDMVIDYFDTKAEFKQKIKVQEDTEIEVSVYYMCCNDKKCLPPKEEIIEIKLKK